MASRNPFRFSHHLPEDTQRNGIRFPPRLTPKKSEFQLWLLSPVVREVDFDFKPPTVLSGVVVKVSLVPFQGPFCTNDMNELNQVCANLLLASCQSRPRCKMVPNVDPGLAA